MTLDGRRLPPIEKIDQGLRDDLTAQPRVTTFTSGRYTEVAPMLLLLLTPWVLFKIFTASLLPSVLLR
jgi:hypothetical protein